METTHENGFVAKTARSNSTVGLTVMSVAIILLGVIFVLLLEMQFASASSLPVNLGSAGNFIILAKSGISTTGTTAITGDIGVSPIHATGITGFGLIMDSSNQFSTSSLVNGKVYASDYAVPTPTVMTTAISDMETAYTDAAGRALPDHVGLGSGNIGGMTLAPGLYKWSTGVTIPTDVILSGGASDVWIFQIAQTLDISSGKKIILTGGADAKNIFWQVAGQTTLGTTSVFNGNILDQTAIVMNTGATLNGRAMAQTAVTLDSNSVLLPITNQTIPPNTTGNQTNQTNTTGNQTNQTNQTTLTCFPSVRYLPVNCTGGTITRDDFNRAGDSCRYISCSDPILDSVNLKACDRPNPSNAQYFEIYRLSFTGIAPQVCLGNDCLKTGWGYQKGSSFPICIGNITLPPNSTGNQTNQTNTTGNQTNQTNQTAVCFSFLQDIPAICNGGTITQNTNLMTFDNCRHITCVNGSNVLDVKACEKPNEINPAYFEMYKQSQTGTGIKICLGTACIQNNGFATQQFPVCGNLTNQTIPPNSTGNQTNQTNQTNPASVSLTIAPWFPQGNNYVFVCNANGFTPTSYDWMFGDGHTNLNYNQNNVYHSYANGTYNVTCTAKNPQTGKTGMLAIAVPTIIV